MRSNCLVFALWKLYKEGGYVIMRKSNHTWLPHFMWSPSIEQTYVVEFKPLNPKSNHWRHFPIGALVFKGRIRRGYGEEGSGTKVGASRTIGRM